MISEGDTKKYLSLSTLNRLFSQPLQEVIIPFSNESLAKLQKISNFYSNLFQTVISFSHNNFEIRVQVDTKETQPFSDFAWETLDSESIEQLFLQFMALAHFSTRLDLDFIDFGTLQIQVPGRDVPSGFRAATPFDYTLYFPITLHTESESHKNPNIKSSPFKYVLETFTKNPRFKHLNHKNLRETYEQLKQNYLFTENQLYIYQYDRCSSTILDTYPLSEVENNTNIKIKINACSNAQKLMIKLNIFNQHRSENLFIATLANPMDRLPYCISHFLLPPDTLPCPTEDFVSIINQLKSYLKTFSFTTLVLMIDRLRTKEDAEFMNYLLEAAEIPGIVLLCFDNECTHLDFDLTLNEKPGNTLAEFLNFTGDGEKPSLVPAEIQLLKIFHALPVPVAYNQLANFFTPGQTTLITELIKKNFLKVCLGGIFLDRTHSRFNTPVSSNEEQQLLKPFLEKPGPGSPVHFCIKIKYLFLSVQIPPLKEALKHLLHERTGIEVNFPFIKRLFSENFLFLDKMRDTELVEIIVSLLVDEHEFPMAKDMICNISGCRQSLLLKLKLAHIYKWEKEYPKMDLILTEIEKKKPGATDKNFDDEYHYLRFIYYEKTVGINPASIHFKKIKGELYRYRASLVLGDRCLYRGNHKKAERLFNEAISYFQLSQYTADEIEAKSLLAKLLRERQSFKEAGELYQNLFIKSEMKNYRLLSAYIAIDLGNLYWTQEKFKAAETWYKKALKIFKSQKNTNGTFLATANLMEFNKIKGNWLETKNQLESILEYDKQKNTIASLGIDYLNIAHLEYLKHRFPSALDFIDIARPLMEKANKWNGLIEGEILRLEILFLEYSPHCLNKLDLHFFHHNHERLSKDQKILVAIVEIAQSDPRCQKQNLIIEKLKQVSSKTFCFEILSLLIKQYKAPEFLELLKSLSTKLSQEEKNHYYYEYFYIYFQYFTDIKEILGKEKERFNEVYYFYQRNQRRPSPILERYQQLLEEKDSQYDLFRSAELVGDYYRWKTPGDLFRTLVYELKKRTTVDLVRLIIYERSTDSKRRWFDSAAEEVKESPTFHDLTQEIISHAVFTLENLDLTAEEIKKRFKSAEKTFYFYKSTKALIWTISESLLGVLLVGFANEDYGNYDFLSRHGDFLKKFASLIRRYYEQDYQLTEKLDFIIGQSSAVKKLKEEIQKISKVDFSLLIRGESGSGKELVAKGVHILSLRSGHPLVAVNAAAIPENLLEAELFGFKKGAFTGATENKPGLIEEAHNGTLFLDEIADLPLNLQAKLLRVLQENEIRRLGENKTRPVSIRLVCATNKDLQEMITAKQFREDLYFRIAVLTLRVPPLRERLEDIPLLVRYFLKKNSFSFTDDENINRLILHYQNLPWTGNIRELESSVMRLITYYPDIDHEFKENPAPRRYSMISGLTAAKEELEKNMIQEALSASNGNKIKAAAALKITRQYLFCCIKKYGIKTR